jgi:hypothetical protein
MSYTYNLIPAPLPAWLDFDGRTWDTHYLSDEQLAAQGWLPLIYDPEGAPLGHADPVAETRDGRQVAVAYACGTEQERTAATLAALKAQAQDLRSAERVRRQTSGFPFGEHRYRSDREESIPLMVSAAIHAQVALAMGADEVAAYNAALGNGWRDETGTARLTTAQEILALHGAFVAWGAANDRASQQIAADIEAAETVEVLEAIIAAIPTDARWPK